MYLFNKFIHDLKEYKDLIWHLTLSDLKSNTARTYIGFLWWVVDPIIYMSVFYLVVKIIFHRGGPNYSAFLFVALIPLKWTISCLVDATIAISSKSGIIQQVYVPKIVFIVVRLMVNTLKFLISVIMMFLFLFFRGTPLSFLVLYFPVIVIIQVLFILSGMIILAHIGVYFRDVKNLMQYATRMLYYLSPVMFSMEAVPTSLAKWLYLNPLTTLIVSYRNILLYQKDPEWEYLFLLSVFSTVFLYAGLKILFHYEKQYAKVI
jgi:ABC-type polysaccharide/polyol phosphate export permease